MSNQDKERFEAWWRKECTHQFIAGGMKEDGWQIWQAALSAGQATGWKQGGVAPTDGKYWTNHDLAEGNNWTLGWIINELWEGYIFLPTTRWAGPILPPAAPTLGDQG